MKDCADCPHTRKRTWRDRPGDYRCLDCDHTHKASAGDDKQRADHFQYLYEQASEGKCGASGLTIGACKATICDCFQFPWVKAPDNAGRYTEAPSGVKGDMAYRCRDCGVLVANRRDHDLTAHDDNAGDGLREAVEALADKWERHAKLFRAAIDQGTREDWEFVVRSLRTALAEHPATPAEVECPHYGGPLNRCSICTGIDS